MDLELFVTRVKRDRNWTEQAALAQWHAFRADESLQRDNQGPNNFPLRLEIPAWVFGDEGTQTSEGDFEEKRVQVMSRSTAANTDALRQMRSEMYHGFSKSDQPQLADISSAMRSALPAGSLTTEDWDAKVRKENHIASLLEMHAPESGARGSGGHAPESGARGSASSMAVASVPPSLPAQSSQSSSATPLAAAGQAAAGTAVTQPSSGERGAQL